MDPLEMIELTKRIGQQVGLVEDEIALMESMTHFLLQQISDIPKDSKGVRDPGAVFNAIWVSLGAAYSIGKQAQKERMMQ